MSAQPGPDLSAHAAIQILENLPDAVAVVRLPDGVIRYTNATFDRQLGYERGALIGQPMTAIHYLDPVALGEQLYQLAESGAIGHQEGMIRFADGSIGRRTYMVTTTEVDGEQVGVAIIYNPDDVRTQVADSVRESEGRLWAILDAAPMNVAIKNLAGEYMYVNRTVTENLGFEMPDLLGKTAATFTHGGTMPIADSTDAEVIETGEAVQFELIVPHRDKTEHTYLASKFPLNGPRGEIVGICTMASDITHQRQAQLALEESERRFRQLAESVDDAFMLLSTSPMEILYTSPNFEAVTGYHLDELRADPRRYTRRLHPDDRDRVVRAVARVGDDLDAITIEYRVIQDDGSVRWIRARSRTVEGVNPTSIRVATIVADITTEREIEHELKRARAIAEQANQRKNEFLSRMSHELRTPLNAILGFGQLLDMDGLLLSASQREAVGHIRRAGDHLLELINEVLDIARIESGELRLSFEAIDVGTTVAEAAALMGSIAAERDVTIEIQPPGPETFGVKADRQRLRQVLINLLSNAVKYNRPGGYVSVAWARDNDDGVWITVHDSGPGIAPEDLERLFRPFERLENALGVEGTGIGLTLTRQLVEAMDGTISVESVVGRGSTFTVWLRATEAGIAPGVRATSNEGVTASSTRPSSTPERTVLYVEDNSANIELVERTLARLPDVRTRVAMRGDEALELLARERVDLVLLDLHLPDMLGDVLLREIRQDPRLAHLPVLVISADATPARVSRLLAQGAADYLTKPFELSLLLDLVQELLPDQPEPAVDQGDASRRI